jgi:hypothetical protein
MVINKPDKRKWRFHEDKGLFGLGFIITFLPRL